jgi:hypothetical protein
MTLDQAMSELAALGSEQTKRTLARHGAKEPFFGVKIGDVKILGASPEALTKSTLNTREPTGTPFQSTDRNQVEASFEVSDPKGMNGRKGREWFKRQHHVCRFPRTRKPWRQVSVPASMVEFRVPYGP